jgi:glutathione S-transferase
MKLCCSPGACSLSPQIALREAGLPYEVAHLDLQQATTAGGC